MFKKCKYVTATEEALTKAQTYVEKFYAKAQEAASSYPESKAGRTYTPPDDQKSR